jgi:hypothetical protein
MVLMAELEVLVIPNEPIWKLKIKLASDMDSAISELFSSWEPNGWINMKFTK